MVVNKCDEHDKYIIFMGAFTYNSLVLLDSNSNDINSYIVLVRMLDRFSEPAHMSTYNAHAS